MNENNRNLRLPFAAVYTADIAPLSDAAVFDRVYASVSSSRREKTDRMRVPKGKCLSLGVEYLLQCACRDFGLDYDAQTTLTNENGKPYFAGDPVFFSLSHSESRVMCAMARCEAGCDVEAVGTAPVEALAGRWFTAAEAEAVCAEADTAARRELFYRFWTLKESFQKCIGRGASLPLNEFSFSLAGETVSVSQTADERAYSFFERGDGAYRYALCLAAPPEACRSEQILRREIRIV